MNKILEKHVYEVTLQYLTKNKLIHRRQFGFQPGKRVSMLLNELTEEVYKNLDDGKATMCIMLDYQKAFDTLGHKKILKALKDVGVNGMMYAWFKEYLRERKYEVNALNVDSERMDLDSGVPQGSFLGPLLFILVTNSLWDYVRDGELYMYADDACILLSDKSTENLYKRAQKTFNIVQAWSHDHGLKLNASKTKYMIIIDERKRDKGKGQLVVHDLECLHERERNGCGCKLMIERVKSAKYLGVWIDEHFTWKVHVSHLRDKLRACLAALVRMGRRADMKIRKLVYMALGDSHLNYGITAWGNCNLTERKKLIRLQNKILRCIFGENYWEKSRDNGIMGLERKFIYRNFVESYFDNTHRIERETVRVTRASSSASYVLPKIRTEYGRKRQAYIIPKIWEILPASLKDLVTYKGVKLFGKEWAFSLKRTDFENHFKIKMKPKLVTLKKKNLGNKKERKKNHHERTTTKQKKTGPSSLVP